MANVSVTSTQSNISVNTSNNTVAVTSTPTTVLLSTTAAVSNASVRTKIGVQNISGFGNLAYDSSANSNGIIQYTGISNSDIYSTISTTNVSGFGNIAFDQGNGDIEYTGVSTSDIRGQFSNTAPITYDSATGVIGLEQTLDDLTLVKYQETVVNNGNISGNVAFDISTGTIHTGTLTGNITDIALTNISSGGSATLILTQDAIGAHYLDTTSGFTNWDFVGNTSTINGAVNAISVISLFYDGTTTYASISRFDGATLDGFTTDDLTEGSTNLYFTNARARAALSSGTGINYNSSTGVIALSDTGLISGVTAGSGLNGGGSSGNVTLNVGTGYGITVNADSIEVTNTEIQAQANIAIGNNTTDNLTEGATNLYWTTARGNSAITTYFGDSANAPFSFAGNVDVQGNLNYENVTDLYVTDQKITLNANAASDATVEIIANRPVAGANTKLRWNETTDIWEFTNNGSTFYPMPTSTDDLAEGSTNLYYANSLVSAYLPTYTGNLDSVGNLTVSGQIKSDTINPAGGGPIIQGGTRFNDLQIDNGGGGFGYGFGTGTTTANQFLIADGTGVLQPATANTSIITEGTNLYYTDARVEAYLSGNTSTINADTIQANAFTGGTFTGDGSDLTEVRAESVEVTLKNADTVTIPKGYPVHATGYSGSGEVECVLADAGNADLMPAHFIAQEELTSTGDTGRGILAGRIQNVDTSTFSVGDTIYVAVGGGYANVAPSGEANLIQNLGIVTRIDATQGGGEVMGAGRSAATPNLDSGNIFIGDSNNGAVTVTPTNNFVTADVSTLYSNTAVTAVIGQFNAGRPSDIWTLSGHSSQIFADATQITANSFSDPTLSAYNTNVYYTKWNAAESGYEIYTDAGLTANVSIGGSSYYGSPTGQAQTSSTVSTPTFELSNALTNVNSIATETGSDFTLTSDSKLQLQERIGYNDTITNVGNINGRGYGLTSQSWNFANETFAYTGTDNIDAIFVSGSFTEGSNVFTVTGACTGKDILVDGNDPSTVNNTSLLTGTVANRFYYNFFLSGGAGYPLSDTAKVVSANTTAVVFDTVASANVTVANASAFGILTGVEDSTTGLGISFLTDNDLTGSGQSNVILDAVLHTQDAYGYPITGPVVDDFDTFTFGTASDYTGDFANATVRSKSIYELNKGVLGTENGLVIGANTSMTNRGINDSITTYGINMMFDGTTDYNAEYGISANTLLPQILFKQYTNNTLQAATPGQGPRLFFSSAYGDITTNPFTQYPRDGQELGRMTFWGSLGNLLAPSSVNPPALISAVAAEDWTASNKTNFYIGANSSGTNDAEIFLAFEDGKLVLASGSDGTTHKDIVLAPAITNTSSGPDGSYTTEVHTFAKAGYANVSATSGAKLTVTHGSSVSGQGDQVITLERSNVSATANVTNDRSSPATNFYGGLSGVDSFRFASALPATFTDGDLVTIGDYTGSVGTYFNGNSYYAKGHPVYAHLNVYALYSDAAMTTPVVSGESSGNYGPDGFFTWSYSGGVTDREWSFTLGAGSEDLVLSSNTTTKVTFSEDTTTFANIPVMPSYSNASLPTSVAGGIIYITNGNNKPAYGDGTNWYYYDNTLVT